ncbi:MAG: TonB-dependent receptor [Candidatus Zixiibacteriota bacterium]|nr:MAG: TonB-dependent receptor [candidate division Zixibacteria bacterium]
MKKLSRISFAATLGIILLLAGDMAWAGVTGKISGVVEDAGTGAPLIGATVRVAGTSLITKTDDDGEYYIISVPAGKYDLIVTHVGFEMVTKKDIRILVDLTTPVDFGLDQVAYQLGDPVVVYASEQAIKRDLTESKITFTSDRLKDLPNTLTVERILSHYPGVLEDRNKEIHIRGGRSGQITYYYDGFSVQDPFVQTAGIRIMPHALEELSLSSGGFGAEYGEALSGVVNAVTREGGAQYHGSIEAYEGFTYLYDVEQGDWGNGLSRHGNRALAFNLSGPLLGTNGKKYNFAVSGEYLRNNTYLPHNWSISYTGAAKLSMQPLANLRLKSNFTYVTEDGDLFEHRDVNGISYDFNLDGLPAYEERAYLAGLSGSYYFNERTILSLAVSRFYTKHYRSPRHLLDVHYTDWEGYSEDANGDYNGTIHEDNYGWDLDYTDPYEALGFTSGDDFDPTYLLRRTEYNSVSAGLVQQVNKANQVKIGVEARKYDIFKDFRQFYNAKPYAETFACQPIYASAYLQDKIEYAYVIVNAGLRWSYRDSDMRYNRPVDPVTWEYTDSEPKSHLAPRLGVSFPVSENSVMHFNYGVYYQTPKFRYLYFNPQGDISSGLPLMGNPDLTPEQTTSYELGLDHLIDDDLRLDVTAYYKDIEQLVTTRQMPVGTVMPTWFTNDDYGKVQGVDLSLEKLPGGGFFSGSISYTYMIATGNGSDPLEPYYAFNSDDSALPVTEYPLDFDQRHTLTAALDWRLPESWEGNWMGMRIPGHWGLSLVGYFGSGLPYTKTDANGNRLGERNEGRLPSHFTVDMRFSKHFRIASGNVLTFFVEVDNLFNERNVLDVYLRTGLPDDDGVPAPTGLTASQDVIDTADRLYDYDPEHFSPPRAIRTGFQLSF